ncbi:MAG: LysR family transcriptional regulator [Pseudomonadales bacterium]|nr:LysR family transcriptional regulator [Pseudomonadales bacterium]
MRYSFRQLEVFLAAARVENLSRAAERLAMSQSAASGALRDLEEQFDVQLFDRIGKRLQLNALGRALQPRAEALLAQARELERALERHEDLGLIKVGATLTIGNYLAVELIARFLKEQPDAAVTLEVGNTAQIAAAVRAFELDVGLIEGELHDSELEVTTWREDELVVFCAPGHPLARRRRLSDRDLRAATWILREQGSGTRQAFDRAMHGLLPELHVLLELQHTEAIKRAVEAELGLGCLSRIALADEFARRRLVPLEVPGRSLARRFYFILHRAKYRGTGLERWLALCRRAR